MSAQAADGISKVEQIANLTRHSAKAAFVLAKLREAYADDPDGVTALLTGESTPVDGAAR